MMFSEVTTKTHAFISMDDKLGLEATAKKLEAVLLNVPLEATDKYDEIPAFEGADDSFAYVLFGYPDEESNLLDQPTDSYGFKIFPHGGTLQTLKNVSSIVAPKLEELLGVKCWADD